MRRGPGIAGLRQAEVARQQYRTAGEEVKKTNLQAMKEHMGTFKRNLEDFARKYKSDIRKDPVFRAQFHTMCANVGVDPLSSSKVGPRRAWGKCLRLVCAPELRAGTVGLG